ncbi:ATP-binding cassette domain-containing protein [Bradyrhizobium huanghuaihaiense]|uniref:ATP-binding cassette domain-containing protein n=1 Tax=Bradyrhizobium huanghuaihaiense TaxID=990078 RepID=UPI0021A98C63|nr:ATP-binding cassette domain-containing protein [Bradyrhizobium sp. CB3035]UWU75848.1 ATP-binding cassette domain-containing protein [Bradyrhizobium sp. CB3035]
MLGPSGSGKRTTLLMLAGCDASPRGGIIPEERSINKMLPHKRDIGMVFENYTLFSHTTVEENLALRLKVRIGKAEIETGSSGCSRWCGSVRTATAGAVGFPAIGSSAPRGPAPSIPSLR